MMLNKISIDVIEMITVSCKNYDSFDEIVKLIPKLNEKYYKDRILDKMILTHKQYNNIKINDKFDVNKVIKMNTNINYFFDKYIYHSSYDKPAKIRKNGTIRFIYDSLESRDNGLPYYISYTGHRAWKKNKDRISLPNEIIHHGYLRYCFNDFHITCFGDKTYYHNREKKHIDCFDYI